MPFNIRVYGVLIQENKILVSDEIIRGKFYTKLPGGGLEFGEGTKDCLKREFMEELNWKVEAGNHLYTTDFFQLSAFNSEDQIISIYYFVNPLENKEIQISDSPSFKETENFRWANLNQSTTDLLSLPIDRIAVDILKEKMNIV